MSKLLKSFLLSFAAITFVLTIFSSNVVVASNIDEEENFIQTKLEDEALFEVNPFSINDYRLEKFEIGGLGMTTMTGAQTSSFVRSAGYASEHAYKYAYLGNNARVSLYNIKYSKVNRKVYILDSNNRGVLTVETF